MCETQMPDLPAKLKIAVLHSARCPLGIISSYNEGEYHRCRSDVNIEVMQCVTDFISWTVSDCLKGSPELESQAASAIQY